MEQKNDLLTEVPCPYCEVENIASDFETVSIGGKTLRLGINTCQKCRLNYISPRLSQKALTLLYDSEYMETTVSGRYNTIEEVSHGEYETFKKYIRHYSKGVRWTLIDVGCGVGNLLVTLRELTNVTAEGVEFSEFAYSRAVANGFKVQKGDLLDAAFASDSCDCITIMYVLEHVPQPFTVIKKVYEILKPGGYLMVAVPNYRYLRLVNNNVVLRYFTGRKRTLHTQEHLQNFTPVTIQAMVAAAGFKITYNGMASPLKTGPLHVRIAKRIAWLSLYFIYRMGYNVGGIHLIAQKPEH